MKSSDNIKKIKHITNADVIKELKDCKNIGYEMSILSPATIDRCLMFMELFVDEGSTWYDRLVCADIDTMAESLFCIEDQLHTDVDGIKKVLEGESF